MKRFLWIAFGLALVATFAPDVLQWHPAQLAADALQMPACQGEGWGDATCWREARND